MIDERTRRLLDDRLAREQNRARLPSVAAGLVRGGELVWSAGRGLTGVSAGGPPAADVQYRAGSITKTFVAVAVLRLRDAGRLSLNDPVGSYVGGAGAAGGLTIGQLLSHTGGLRAETAGPWWERTAGGPFADLAAASLGADAARWRAGRRFHYSNVGYALLGELLARMHGAAWDQVVARELLGPLGMARTTTRPRPPWARGLAVHPHADLVLPEPEHDAGAMAPAGQLWTTVSDLAIWARFLAGGTGGPLSDDTLAEMREPLGVEDMPGQPWAVGYGLGLQLWNDAGVHGYGHTGSMPGFVGVLRIDAESGDAAIALCNSTTGFDMALGADLLRILAECEPVSPSEWVPAPAEAGIADMLGTWYWGPAQFALRLAGDTLKLERAGGRPGAIRFRRRADGTWTGLDGYHAGEPLVPVRDAEGNVVSLDLGSFVYTRTPYDPAAPVPGGVDPDAWRADPDSAGRQAC
jgi:CubicO group peptidase (beta-lactamase class C family)